MNVSNANYKYTPSTAAATNYVPDALNRIASVNGASFGYDGRGNLTQDNTGTTYTYNANNLLLNATKSGVATTLSYDAENRLYSVAKSGATTKFMYDGTDLIAETNASNGILRRYVHGPETDDPIVWYEGSGTGDKRYYTANRQGSIVGVTLQNGLSTSVNSYDEYGIQKLSTIGRFQYTGQTWIPEVGLYYYKARFYNPNLGRFMQTDPIGYKDGMNWYAYVGGDPVNKTDPSGMAQCGKNLKGNNCEMALNDADAARDTARTVASELKGIASRVKDGKLTAADKAEIKALDEKGYKTSEGGLTKLANGLEKAANKIGERNSGLVLRSNGNAATNEATKINFGIFTVHTGVKLNNDHFNERNSSVRQRVILHEAVHNTGIYGDAYFKSGIDSLIGNDKAFWGNADTYACVPYATACGY